MPGKILAVFFCHLRDILLRMDDVLLKVRLAPAYTNYFFVLLFIVHYIPLELSILVCIGLKLLHW